MQPRAGEAPDPTTGNIAQIKQAVVEENVINNTNTNTGVTYANSDSVKFFNNQNSGGTLLRGYSSSTPKQELQDFVDDALLGF